MIDQNAVCGLGQIIEPTTWSSKCLRRTRGKGVAVGSDILMIPLTGLGFAAGRHQPSNSVVFDGAVAAVSQLIQQPASQTHEF